MTRLKDLTGNVFGRLTAIDHVSINGRVNWRCSCSCGNEVTTLSTSLVEGKTKSCGCLKRDETSARFKTHGMSESAEYTHWANMLARCTNPNDPDYEHYSSRGITVCHEFQESFQSFYDEIGPKPPGKWSVGRISNIGSYTVGNIRWETDGEQARNHSLQKNNTSGVAGVSIVETPTDGTRINSRYSNADGKRKSKSFSVNKYGFETAMRLAVEWRESKLAELSSQGITYGEHHGRPHAVKECYD